MAPTRRRPRAVGAGRRARRRGGGHPVRHARPGPAHARDALEVPGRRLPGRAARRSRPPSRPRPRLAPPPLLPRPRPPQLPGPLRVARRLPLPGRAARAPSRGARAAMGRAPRPAAGGVRVHGHGVQPGVAPVLRHPRGPRGRGGRRCRGRGPLARPRVPRAATRARASGAVRPPGGGAPPVRRRGDPRGLQHDGGGAGGRPPAPYHPARRGPAPECRALRGPGRRPAPPAPRRHARGGAGRRAGAPRRPFLPVGRPSHP